MKKRTLIFSAILVLIIVLSLTLFLNKEKEESEFNFKEAINTLSLDKYENLSGTRRFAIDGEIGFPQTLDAINLIGDDLSELQGTAVAIWGLIEPNAPVNNISTYLGMDDLKENKKTEDIFRFFQEFKKTNRELSALIEFYDNDWAIEYHPTIKSQSPKTGEMIPSFVRIKPEHHQDYKNFIKYYISIMPNLKYIQIDNEPENAWASGEGYVEALKLTMEAVKEYNTENVTDVKVLAAGFSLYPALINMDEDMKMYVYKNYPNINESYVRQQLNIPSSISSSRVLLAAQKIHVTYSVLLQENPPFDILTIHNDFYEQRSEVIKWWLDTMKEQGYQRPLWIDDMHSGYYPNAGPRGSNEDLELFNKLKENNPQAIKEYNKNQSTWLVRKAIQSFSVGAQRVKISQIVDMSAYFMPEWRYVGLFTEDYKPKPSYYTTVLLVNKLDYFETATELDGNVYKFTFDHKEPMYVAWSEEGNKTVDLSSEFGNVSVKITYLVNEIDTKYQPIVRKSIIVSSKAIPVTEEPVFIESE